MRIVIDLEAEEPPTGRMVVGAGPPREFAGWLALLRLLDDLLGARGENAGPAP